MCHYRPPTKLQEGNVFTDICLSTGGISGPMSFQGCGWVDISSPMSLLGVCPGGGYVLGGGYPSKDRDTMGYGRQSDGTHPTRMLSC